MNDRVLGRSELRVSALAFGTVELGMDYGINAPGHFGRPTLDAAIELVHAALDRGINFIDTARAYGESESVLGRALRGKRAAVILATKANAHLPDGTVPVGKALRQHLLAQLETSLQQLQTEHVDLWQIHNVDDAVLAETETVATLFADLQQRGLIRASGGSFYGATLPIDALQHDLFDVMQVTYSVFDQRVADELLPLAAAQNIGIMVRSVLLKGALTARAEHLPDQLEPLRAHSRQWRQRATALLPTLTPAQAALAFALANPQIHSVLVGMRTLAELEDNLQAFTATVTPEIIAELQEFRLTDAALLNPATWGIP